MTQPTLSPQPRPPAGRALPPIHRPASPPESGYLADILGTTHSAWWEADRKYLSDIGKLAALKKPFPPYPRPEAAHNGDGLVALADLQRVADFLGRLSKAKLPSSLDYRISSDGSFRWVRHCVLHRTARGPATRYSGVITDITELRNLEAEILQISEREQNRIGQDLHDDLCQVLAGLSCLTRVLENRIAPLLPDEVGNLREINQELVDAMDRTRALTHGLYPAKMRTNDVRPALLELAKQVEVRFGVTVRTAFRGRFPDHAAHEILQVYRIAQEAISNSIRHGRANRIGLTLCRLTDGMRLSIRDNGTGSPSAQPPQHGIGLQIMHHRASQLGAKIEIGNAPRRGALVLLRYQPAALL